MKNKTLYFIIITLLFNINTHLHSQSAMDLTVLIYGKIFISGKVPYHPMHVEFKLKDSKIIIKADNQGYYEFLTPLKMIDSSSGVMATMDFANRKILSRKPEMSYCEWLDEIPKFGYYFDSEEKSISKAKAGDSLNIDFEVDQQTFCYFGIEILFEKNSSKMLNFYDGNHNDSILMRLMCNYKEQLDFVYYINAYADPNERNPRKLISKRAKEVKRQFQKLGFDPERIVIDEKRNYEYYSKMQKGQAFLNENCRVTFNIGLK